MTQINPPPENPGRFNQTLRTFVNAIFPIWVKSQRAQGAITAFEQSHHVRLCLLLWLRLWLESTTGTSKMRSPNSKAMAVQRYMAMSGENSITFRVVGLKSYPIHG